MRLPGAAVKDGAPRLGGLLTSNHFRFRIYRIWETVHTQWEPVSSGVRSTPGARTFLLEVYYTEHPLVYVSVRNLAHSWGSPRPELARSAAFPSLGLQSPRIWDESARFGPVSATSLSRRRLPVAHAASCGAILITKTHIYPLDVSLHIFLP